MLAIDLGNSRLKWALYKHDKMISHNVVDYDENTLGAVLEAENLPLMKNRVIISHVATEQVKLILSEFLQSHQCNDYIFAETRSAQCQITNSYDVVENMGVDRWLAMIAAYHSPKREVQDAVCVIDCGTAITLDVVASDGKHLGGLIMPGYQTMYMSLMNQTGHIKKNIDSETEAAVNKVLSLGSSTTACVEVGCRELMLEGVSAIANRHCGNFEGNFLCMVTGGDGKSLVDRIDGKVMLSPYLVLDGLCLVASDLLASKS